MATLMTLSGGAAWILKWLLDRRKTALDEAEALLAEMRRLHDMVVQEHQTCRAALAKAEEQIERLVSRVDALEADDSPFFSWIDGPDGKVLSMSTAFRRGVLAPAGLQDGQVLGHRLIDLEQFAAAAAILVYLERRSMLSGYSGACDVMLTDRRWAVLKALVIAPDGSRQIHCSAVPL